MMTPASPLTAASPPVLRVENLSKHYAGVAALRGVNLSIAAGSIHGLLGENGAGKSTLVGIICGQIRPSSGTVTWQGKPLGVVDVRAMEQAGVFLVTQEPMIVAALSAAENLLLGLWPKKRSTPRAGVVSWSRIDWSRLQEEAARMLDGTGIDPLTPAGQLGAVAQRKLNILRAMFSGARLIVLDEPTASLTQADRQHLFAFMRERQREGVTFVFISHFNDEILEICDAVSVLRDGRHVGTHTDVQALSSAQLSEMVLGRDLTLFQRAVQTFSAHTPPAVRLLDIRSDVLKLPALTIAAGEVLGITSLPGAGGKELARALFGLQRASGTIAFGTDPAKALPRHPAEAFARGIAYLSDDRRRDGAVAHMSIAHNLSLSVLATQADSPWIAARQEADLVRHWFDRLGIKATSPAAAVDSLSGGNQQKVCLARVLATRPQLLILDEPTRGIDVGVKQEVLRIVSDLSAHGVAIIIVSTDTDELARAVDRVLVFRDGSIHRELSRQALTQSALRQLA